MKIVKASVIIMGVLIVLGMGLLIYGFVTRLGKAPTEEAAQDTVPLVPLNVPLGQDKGLPAAAFGDVRIALAEGEIVLDVQAEGTRLLLRTKMPDGAETIRVFDLSTGEALGRFMIGR